MNPSQQTQPTAGPAAQPTFADVRPTGLPRPKPQRTAVTNLPVNRAASVRPGLATAAPAAGQPQIAAGSGQPNTAVAPPGAAPTPHPNSTQNSLQIAEIRDGIVIMNDGSF